MQNSNACIPITMLILLILLDMCVQGWSKTSIVYFTSGNNVTLNCPLNTSVKNITWRKSNDIINDVNNKINHMILNNEKYNVVSNQSNRNMLHIQMASDDEVGEYYCETTINNFFKEESIQLVKRVVPIVSVRVIPNSTIYEGTEVTFQCIHDVASLVVVNWFKDGSPIQSFKSNFEYIYNITRFDAGVYSCRVTKNEQFGLGDVSITILYSPDVLVIDYNNGTLFCNASGNPDKYTYAQWEHRSAENRHIRYINGSEDGYLHITDLESHTWFHYSGVYTCFAENGVIRNDKLFQSGSQHIMLKGTPQCLQNSMFEYGIQGQSTIIFIEIHSVPKFHSFHWKILTGNITDMSSKYATTVTGTHFKTLLYDGVSFRVAIWKFSLVIYDLNQDDFDIYTLQVANKIGQSSCSVLLKPANFPDKNNMLYLGILTFSVILLLSSVICNICIHIHCKKLSRVPLQTGSNEVSGLNIEMTDINNGYHTINEEDIRQEDNEVENQSEIHNTYDSSSNDSDDKSAESVTDETGLRESDDYVNPYCTMIQNTVEVHTYKTLGVENSDSDITAVNLNTELQGSYENLKF